MKNKKVAVLLHGLGANGIDTLFANLAGEWNKDKFEVTYLLAVDENSKQFWENKVLVSGVRVIKLHDLDKGRLFRWPLSLYKALQLYGPFDVVHTNMDMLNGINLLAAKIAGVKIRVCHAHKSNDEIPKSFLKRALQFFYIRVMKLMMKSFSTSRIGCSDLAGDYFFGKDNYKLIYNGIDLSKYHTDRGDNISGGFRFIAVGRIATPKNPIKLVKIFEAICRRHPEASLVWLGDGVLRTEVESTIKSAGIENKVKLLGIKYNVADYLKEADCYLLPSLSEGLSLALAEAQAAGLECFVSDTCSRLSDCGLCMYIPLNASAEEWADRICAHLESGMRMKPNSELLNNFSISRTAELIEEQYA